MGKVAPSVLKRMLAAGTRVEVGQPFPMGGDRGYMCLAKVVGRKYEVGSLEVLSYDDDDDDDEGTQTLCVVSEEGDTPEEAHARLMARLRQARVTSTMPPPAYPRRGWLGRLIAAFK
jgi:hypothetical protein